MHNINYFQFEDPRSMPPEIMRMLTPEMKLRFLPDNPMRKAISIKNKIKHDHRNSCSECKVYSVPQRTPEGEKKASFKDILSGRVELNELTTKEKEETTTENKDKKDSFVRLIEKINRYKGKRSERSVKTEKCIKDIAMTREKVETAMKNAPSKIGLNIFFNPHLDMGEEEEYDAKRYMEEYRLAHPKPFDFRTSTPRVANNLIYSTKKMPPKTCEKCTRQKRFSSSTPNKIERCATEATDRKKVIAKFNAINKVIGANSRAAKHAIEAIERASKVEEIKQRIEQNGGHYVDGSFLKKATDEVANLVNFTKIYQQNSKYSYSRPIQVKPKTTNCWLLGSPREQLQRKDLIFEIQSMDNIRKQILSE